MLVVCCMCSWQINDDDDDDNENLNRNSTTKITLTAWRACGRWRGRRRCIIIIIIAVLTIVARWHSFRQIRFTFWSCWARSRRSSPLRWYRPTADCRGDAASSRATDWPGYRCRISTVWNLGSQTRNKSTQSAGVNPSTFYSISVKFCLYKLLDSWTKTSILEHVVHFW